MFKLHHVHVERKRLTDIESASEKSASRPSSQSNTRQQLQIQIPEASDSPIINPASTQRDSATAQITPLPSGAIARPPSRSMLEAPSSPLPNQLPRNVFDDAAHSSPISTYTPRSGIGAEAELYPLQLLAATKPLYQSDEGLRSCVTTAVAGLKCFAVSCAVR